MAYDFDGANDNISFGATPTLIKNPTGGLTISIWAWLDIDTADQTLVVTKPGVGGGFLFYFDDVGSVSGRTNVFNIYTEDDGGSNARIEGATGSGTTGMWNVESGFI